MEQEQTIYKLKDVSKLTGEALLKMLLYMAEHVQDRMQNYQANRHFKGETNWNKFMATDAEKAIKTFKNQEINLKRLKDYLKDYHIGFTHKEMKDGTLTLAFEVKNQAMVEKAFESVLADVVNPERLEVISKRILKTPQNMTTQEKLSYYQAKTKEAIAEKTAQAPAMKAPKKPISKEEVKA